MVGNQFNPSITGQGIHLINYSYTDGNACDSQDSFFIYVTDCSSIEKETCLSNRDLNAYCIYSWLILNKSKRILADIVYIVLFYCVYRFIPFYQANLDDIVLTYLSWIGIFFIGLSILVNLLTKKRDDLHVIFALWHFLKESIKVVKSPVLKNLNINIDEREKIKLRGFIVKLFFIPIMLTFFMGNYGIVTKYLDWTPEPEISGVVQLFNQYYFALVFAAILVIDTFIFLIAYLFESKYLKNEIRSVDTSLFGWVVTLFCYPPFNEITVQYINRVGETNTYFYNDSVTFIVRIVILLLFSFYLLASFNLGFKASNLTNRGIVKKGAYGIIRHPAYVSKTLVWWITTIPLIYVSPGVILAPLAWSMIYFLRAITEERHLIKDPDYQEYCKAVKYRFIPRLY